MTTSVYVRLQSGLLAEVDAYAERHGIRRPAAIRQLVKSALCADHDRRREAERSIEAHDGAEVNRLARTPSGVVSGAAPRSMLTANSAKCFPYSR